jgi:hypothetical protein
MIWGLSAWWALFAWHPQDEPPAWALFGPFPTREECITYLREHGLPPFFEPIRCVELKVPDADGVDVSAPATP